MSPFAACFDLLRGARADPPDQGGRSMARRLSSSGLVACVLVATASSSRPRPAYAAGHDEVVDYATSFGNFGRDAYVYVAMEKCTSSRPGSTSR